MECITNEQVGGKGQVTYLLLRFWPRFLIFIFSSAWVELSLHTKNLHLNTKWAVSPLF